MYFSSTESTMLANVELYLVPMYIFTYCCYLVSVIVIIVHLVIITTSIVIRIVLADCFVLICVSNTRILIFSLVLY